MLAPTHCFKSNSKVETFSFYYFGVSCVFGVIAVMELKEFIGDKDTIPRSKLNLITDIDLLLYGILKLEP